MTATLDATTSFVAALGRHRVVPVVRHDDADAALEIARACIAGGMGLVEVTLTTPRAAELVTTLVAEAPDGVTVGAGTVVTPADVEASVAAGAAFLVSPATVPDAIAAAVAAGRPMVPGAATPSEVALGSRCGAPVVKLFPAGTLGVSFLRAVRATMPAIPLLPSGGVRATDVPTWLDAGALAVAIGSELNTAHAQGGVDAVTALAAAAVATAGPDQDPTPRTTA